MFLLTDYETQGSSANGECLTTPPPQSCSYRFSTRINKQPTLGWAGGPPGPHPLKGMGILLGSGPASLHSMAFHNITSQTIVAIVYYLTVEPN